MEILADNAWLAWTVIAVVCLIMEVTSGDFFLTCFALGACCGLVTGLLGLPLWLQVLVFAVCSVLSIFFFRPRLAALLHKGADLRKSNADALLGRIGRVSEAIGEGGYGRVQIDGDDWKAESIDGTGIERGASVRVVGRESIIIKVEKEK